jgi:DNA polymerase (family 10)
MKGPPYPIAMLRELAERVKGELEGYCERIEIAGSIRRGRPYCGDIDLVVLPKGNEPANALARGQANEREFKYGYLHALKERCKQNAEVVTDGDMNLIVRLRNGVQLDIFIAQRESRDLLESKPTNFGSLLLCRTGSAAHNIWLVERAKGLGKRWNPYYGVFVGKTAGGEARCIASATEEDIFAALDLEFIAPERRER